MAKPAPLRPEKLAPFFVLTALFHAASVLSRFSEVAAKLPAGISDAIFLAQMPLLFAAGFFEGRLDYGDAGKNMPGWMRITSRPVKLSFTFAFVYLGIVVLETWDISIGPIDPTPPESFPLPQRAMWFGMMTVGMFFPNYLAAAGLLIPTLRVVTAPFRLLPASLGLPIVVLLGGAVGVGLFALFASARVGSEIAAVNAILERPAIAIGLAFAMVLVPLVFEKLLELRKGDGD